MQPVSVDTNLLVRGPLGDDPAQQSPARRVMEGASKGDGLVVSAFAVIEMAWVLRARKIPRNDVARAIRTLMDSEGVTVTHAEVLFQALARYEEGEADLGECLIWADGQASGARIFATFDQVPQEEGWGVAPASILEMP
ncbi:MAG: type II toxin-antitoxin system VapC family toxin [Holophaga sp.]|jgi:predicted nucleic-acid-binding protein